MTSAPWKPHKETIARATRKNYTGEIQLFLQAQHVCYSLTSVTPGHAELAQPRMTMRVLIKIFTHNSIHNSLSELDMPVL